MDIGGGITKFIAVIEMNAESEIESSRFVPSLAIKGQ